jgi:hypothetical protein
LFHLHSRHGKRKNFIVKIVTNGQILTGHEDKAKVVIEFYENLLGTVDTLKTRYLCIQALSQDKKQAVHPRPAI